MDHDEAVLERALDGLQQFFMDARFYDNILDICHSRYIDPDAVMYWLDEGADPCVYYSNSEHNTAFHLVALVQSPHVSTVLLPMLERVRDGRISRAACTQRDAFGMTPLQVFLQHWRPPNLVEHALRAFFRAGFDPNSLDGHLRPTLAYAVEYRRVGLIRAFLEAGAAPVPAHALERSSTGRHYDLVDLDGDGVPDRLTYDLAFAHDVRGCLARAAPRALPPEMVEIVLTVATRVPMRYIERLVR